MYLPSNKEINELDKFVFRFVKILEKHADYVIVGGFVPIMLRISLKDTTSPNFKIKIAKTDIEISNFLNRTTVITNLGTLYISPLNVTSKKARRSTGSKGQFLRKRHC